MHSDCVAIQTLRMLHNWKNDQNGDITQMIKPLEHVRHCGRQFIDIVSVSPQMFKLILLSLSAKT